MSSPSVRHISKLGGYDLMLVFAATHNVVYYLHVVIDFLSRWPGVAVVKSTLLEKTQPSLEGI